MGYFKIKNIFPLLLFFVLPISVFGASYIGSGFPNEDFNVIWKATGTVCGYDLYTNTQNNATISHVLYYISGNPSCTIDWRIRYGQGDGQFYNTYGGTTPDSGTYIGFYGGSGTISIYTPPPPPAIPSFFEGGTSNDLVANLGTVSGNVYDSALSWIFLSVGVFLAFYILQKLIMLQPKPKKEKKDRIIRDKAGKQIGIDVSKDGYHRITGKKGQVIGWAKD